MYYRAALLLVFCWSLLSVSFIGAAAQNLPQGSSYVGESRATYRIFILGDKLAGGLWAGAARLAADDRRLTVQGRFREGSGLIRRRNYDWPQAAEKIRNTNRIEIAVLMLGTNDARDLSAGEGGHRLGSQPWRQAYRQRLIELIKPFADEGIAVYVVGLPVMRSPEYNAAIKIVSEIQEQTARELKVRFVDTREVFANPDGSYTENGVDIEGRQTRLRSRNGVHFIVAGNNKLAMTVFTAIRADIDVADGKRAADTVAAPDGAIQKPADVQLPLFGYATITGTEKTISNEDLPDPTAFVAILQSRFSRPSGSQSGRKLLQRLRAVAPKNSAAEKLFSSGVWINSPTGRIDDFTWTDSDIKALQ